MATRRITPLWNYLHEASNPSLESFELSRLNHAANLRKEIAALLDQWIEETAEAILARWVREDRKFPQSGERLDILPQAAELPFSTPQSVSVRPRRADNRRLRATRRSPHLGCSAGAQLQDDGLCLYRQHRGTLGSQRMYTTKAHTITTKKPGSGPSEDRAR